MFLISSLDTLLTKFIQDVMPFSTFCEFLFNKCNAKLKMGEFQY